MAHGSGRRNANGVTLGPTVPLLPRHWPIAVKLALSLILVAFVPLAVVAVFNAQALEHQTHERETLALEHRAAEAARRVEERVGRLRAYVEHVATNPSILAAVRDQPDAPASVVERAQAWDERHPEIEELLVSVRQANPWFRNVYLLTSDGVCVSSSERDATPAMVGRVYDYRPYFRAPVATRQPFVSDLLKNATSPGTAIFVSAPIVVDREVAAVAVLKVDSYALHDIVEDLSERAGRALLVDRFGVVVSDAAEGATHSVGDDGSLQFRPLADVSRYLPRFEETKRYGNPDGDNYLERVKSSLTLEALWSALRTHGTGAREFDFPLATSGKPQPTMVGYAPVWSLAAEPYGFVVLAEPSAEFREPLLDLGREALLRFLVVIGLVILVFAILIRRLSTRLTRLAEAATAVAEGNLRSTVEDGQRDELGRLAKAFRDVARKVRERESTQQHQTEELTELIDARAKAERRALLERLHASVRQPLSEVETLVDKLDGDDEGLAAVREHVQTGLDAADAMLSLTRDVALNKQRFSLGPLLEDLAERARPKAGLHQSKVVVDGDDVGEVVADPRLLRLVVHELLDNACKFTRRGTVRLSAQCTDTELKITVRDDGIGIPRRALARLREGAVTGSGESTQADQPPGLGLPIAYELVRRMGGRLRLDSVAGDGTAASVILPPK